MFGGKRLNNLIKVYMSGKNYNAEGYYNISDGKLTVLKGSRVVREEPLSFRQYYNNVAKIRDELINKDIISNYEFVGDYIFEIPFHASGVVQANGQAGGKAWRTVDGITIDNILNRKKHFEEFKEFLKTFKSDVNKEKTDKVIEEFQTRFPLDNLRNMTIEEYDKTGDKTTLSYAIEHGTNYIFSGFLGNNRNKIFYNTPDGEYDAIEWVKNKYLDITLLEMFEQYKRDIYTLIKDFSIDTYTRSSIGALPANTNTIRSKLIMLYRPYELLHIGSLAVFKKIFKYFGIDFDNDSDSIEMNIKLKAFLERNLEIDIDIVELSRALWIYYENEINIKNEPIKPSIMSFEDLFIEDEYINEIVNVMKRKKNIILRGVPGVGKTYCIKTIIKRSFDNLVEDSIEMIQFHQSYSYEEFVEGLRPQMSGGYDIEKGLFYDISTRAKDNPDNNYFLVIDEINRGNLSKIFGELLLLVENDKRDSYSVKMAYSKEEFSIPSNLYIIGTMNTTDRSLTLVDYALRRRFSFLTLEPAFNTKKFNDYLKNKMGLEEEQVIKINNSMEKINSIIGDTLGEEFKIGHSYYISNKEDINDFDSWYNEIAKYEIIPMLEEYYFDDIGRIDKFKEILGA